MLLLDEVAGGLVEHETAALVELIKQVRATGVSIVWIEHVVHALIAAVDRLVVLHGGALIAEGDPAEVIRRPQVAEIYMGIEEPEVGPMPDRLLEVRALDAHYGDFQALFGVSMGVTEGEVVAVIGANGAGKSTLLKSIAGAMRSRRDAIRVRGRADRRFARRTRSSRAASRWCRRGGGCFPRSPSRKIS